MKKVAIKTLLLDHWRAQNRAVRFAQDTHIKGDNRQGKSSVVNAILWLLTGSDEYDRTNYNMFDITVEQTYENAVPASVEAVFDIDGNEYTFKKVAKQGWARTRGSSTYERKGTDTYQFYVDGIEVSATNYKETVESLFAPIDKLKIMLNIRYFLMLDWKDMRKQLECLVGEIKESDFKGDYSEIEADLKKYTTEQLKTAYRSQKREITKTTESLPQTIETLKRNLPDMSGVDEAGKVVEECNAELDKLMNEMQGKASSLQPYIDKRNEELKEISALEEEYKKAESAYKQNYFDKLAKCQSKIAEIERKNAQIERDNRDNRARHEALKIRIENKKKELKELQAYRENLLEQNKEIKSLVFTENVCPFCGQELPEDKLEEQKAKFNEKKENKHKAIVTLGKANNANIQACQEEIAHLTDELQQIAPFDRLPEDTSKAEAECLSVKNSYVVYEQTVEGKTKKATIEEKKQNLTIMPEVDNSEFIIKRSALTAKKDEALKKLGLKDEYEKQITKIANYQEELKANNIERAKIEGKIAKVDEYEQERAEIINMKVSNQFKYISVKMSEQNKSGDFVPACTITDNEGVNATVTNNASRILCGIDISLAFQNFFGLQLPIFIDNFESVNKNTLPSVDNQLIKLSFDYCNFQVGYGS